MSSSHCPIWTSFGTGAPSADVPELARKVLDSIDVFRCVENYVPGQMSRIDGDFGGYAALPALPAGVTIGARVVA
jgi:hypothetical protein